MVDQQFAIISPLSYSNPSAMYFFSGLASGTLRVRSFCAVIAAGNVTDLVGSPLPARTTMSLELHGDGRDDAIFSQLLVL